MKLTKICVSIFLASAAAPSAAFTHPSTTAASVYRCTSTTNIIGNSKEAVPPKCTSLFPKPRSSQKLSATTFTLPEEAASNNGIFTFKTKYGYLNPYAIYYGITSILLGLPWFIVLTMTQIMYKITNNKWDKMKRAPIFFSQIWGHVLLKLTGSIPEIEGKDILKKFYKENRAAMFVANHNSWMDIPFVGITVGWRNYKLISKAELGKVPILGKAISVGGHVMVIGLVVKVRS